MYSLKELKVMVEKAVLEKRFAGSPTELYEPMDYLMNIGGKRLRPCLVLLGNNLFQDSVNAAIPAAVAMEVFHNFTLMHDDIMDKAPLRRGNPTVHAKWNENTAILSGDAMLVEAYRLLLSTENDLLRSVLNIFNTMALRVCEGQQMDMNFESSDCIEIEDYLCMIMLKTAALLGACLQVGATLAKANADQAGHLYQFGCDLGVAFQLQDDLLDVYGDPTQFGKQRGGDILANKKTYLSLKALEVAGDKLPRLTQWMNGFSISPHEKIAGVIDLYDELGIQEMVEKEIKRHAENAFLHLERIEVEPLRKKPLQEFAKNLMLRAY